MPGKKELITQKLDIELSRKNSTLRPNGSPDFKSSIKDKIEETEAQLHKYSIDSPDFNAVIYAGIMQRYIELIKLYKILEKDDKSNEKYIININISERKDASI